MQYGRIDVWSPPLVDVCNKGRRRLRGMAAIAKFVALRLAGDPIEEHQDRGHARHRPR